MNVKAITLTVFFVSVFSLYLVRFIVRLRKLKKIRGNLTEKGFVLGAYFDVCGCCCDIMCCDCDAMCCDTICCMSELGCSCFDACYSETAKKQREKRADRKSDAAERKTTEKRLRLQKEYLAEIEQEKLGRKGRVEALRASGYTATEAERHKVIELLSVNPKTNLLWTSTAARLSIEEIVIILENEPDFEIRDDYIINKKKKPKMEFLTIEERAKRAEELEEEKIKIAKNICPNCENPFESGSVFCLNCGYELKK